MIQLVTRDIIAVLAKRKRARASGTKLPLTYEFAWPMKLLQSHFIQSLAITILCTCTSLASYLCFQITDFSHKCEA